ncbi:hypothetical protein D3C85_1230520 [compost metagenome]
MVVAQRQGQHLAPVDGVVTAPPRFLLGPGHTQDGHLGGIHDRGERGATEAAQRTDGEAASAHLSHRQALVARLGRDRLQLRGQFGDALAITVAQHRHEQAKARVHGHADVEILLQHQVFAAAIQGGVELREAFQRPDHRLDQIGQQRQLGRLARRVARLAPRLELGDVGIILVGDMWNHHPVARHVLSRQLLHPAERAGLDLAKLTEVNLRPSRQLATEGRRCLLDDSGFGDWNIGAHVLLPCRWAAQTISANRVPTS